MPKHFNMDANESIFFARQLNHIKAKLYNTAFPEFKARKLLPVDFSAGPGATTITYRQYTEIGMAKIIANYAKDLPNCSVKGKEFTSPVRSLGASYGYSIQDVRSAQMAGVDLKGMEANSAKRGILQKENSIAYFGDTENGLAGFLNNANLSTAAAPADGVGATTTFSTKSPDMIIRDITDMINDIKTVTKGVEMANTVLLAVSTYTLLATTPRSTNSDTTILDFLKKVCPEITLWDWLPELETAGTGSTVMAVAYNRNPDKISLEIPSDFEQFPEQPVGLTWEVPCHERVGGVIMYYPLAANSIYGL